MKKIIATCLLMTSGLSFAEGAVMSNATIKALRVRATSAYILVEGCKKYAQVFMVGTSMEYYKALYVTAVSAATAKKKINIQFNEDAGCMGTEEPTIKYLEAVY